MRFLLLFCAFCFDFLYIENDKIDGSDRGGFKQNIQNLYRSDLALISKKCCFGPKIRQGGKKYPLGFPESPTPVPSPKKVLILEIQEG